MIAVGPFHTPDEWAALTRMLPESAAALWMVIDAPVTVTFARDQADPTRGLSRDPGFHRRAHQRFREHLPTIPPTGCSTRTGWTRTGSRPRSPGCWWRGDQSRTSAQQPQRSCARIRIGMVWVLDPSVTVITAG